MKKTKYFILSPGITPESLKKQYRALSKQYHPDKPTGDHAKFAEMNIEYHNLLNDYATKAHQSKDTVEYSNLTFQIDRHLKSIISHINSHKSLYNTLYKEIKQPLISLFPQKYHPFLEDLTLLIEKYTNKGN